MVAPVTGPVTRASSSASVREERIFYRQKPPYQPLAGQHRLVINTSWDNYGFGVYPTSMYPNTTPWTTGEINYLPPEFTDVRNRVISRVLDSLDQADTAALGVAAVQYAQAQRTIVTRTRQLIDFSIGLKRLDVGRIRRALGVNADQYQHNIPKMPKFTSASKRGWRNLASDYGGAWLEWSWGISPTIDDIVNSANVLNSAPHLVVPLASQTREGKTVRNISGNTKYRYEWLSSSPYSNNTRVEGKVFYRLTGYARLKDPNRLLWTQLGLDEPLSVAVEVIPWSFLVGWVSNLSDYLRNWSPIRSQYEWVDLCETFGKTGTMSVWWNTYGWRSDWDLHLCKKNPIGTLPDIVFRFKPLRFSPSRAANAIGLLSTFLKNPSSIR